MGANIAGKLTGKAKKVCVALSVQEGLDYDLMKGTILQAYELVPEAYRQRFRGFRGVCQGEKCFT